MSKKEKNVQRHKMAVAIYREMTPEKQAELIAENKKKHAEMCANRRMTQEHHREMLKKGREFAVKNGVSLFYGSMGGYAISAGALLRTVRTEGEPDRVVYDVAYALCSHRDTPSMRAANGYIGWRLMERSTKTHPYTFTINLTKSGAIIPERLAQLIRLHIELDVVTRRVSVPGRLQRATLQGSAICHLSPAAKMRKTPKKILRSLTKAQ